MISGTADHLLRSDPRMIAVRYTYRSQTDDFRLRLRGSGVDLGELPGPHERYHPRPHHLTSF
jgi:hypothetical protein